MLRIQSEYSHEGLGLCPLLINFPGHLIGHFVASGLGLLLW